MTSEHPIDLARRLREEAVSLREQSARTRAEARLARTAPRKALPSEGTGTATAQQRNSATAQQRNSATAQQRNSEKASRGRRQTDSPAA